MAPEKYNIFVVGLDDFNRRMLDTIQDAANYTFHGVLPVEEVAFAEKYVIPQLLSEARARLDTFPDPIHGIIGWWDFPTSHLLPMLRAERGLSGPTLEAVLRCEHKAWSRILQKEVLPDNTPNFQVINPDKAESFRDLGLSTPFFMKPVKSHSSYLGFLIKTEEDWEAAVKETRENIQHFADPFNYFLERADLPEDVRHIDGRHCVAEEIIGGRQATLECYVHKGEPVVYGVVDSIKEPNGISFRAYQYPSRLPREIQDRMTEAAKTFARHVKLDETPFNVEFFWDEKNDKLWMLEINARLSKSHCPLFAFVDGASHQQVAVRLSLGEKPEMPFRQGEYAFASKYMMRVYEDAHVARVPTDEEIGQLHREFGCLIRMEVKEGQFLHELLDQDSYSYEVGVVFIGGRDFDDVEDKYERLRNKLPLHLEPVEAGKARRGG